MLTYEIGDEYVPAPFYPGIVVYDVGGKPHPFPPSTVYGLGMYVIELIYSVSG